MQQGSTTNPPRTMKSSFICPSNSEEDGSDRDWDEVDDGDMTSFQFEQLLTSLLLFSPMTINTTCVVTKGKPDMTRSASSPDILDEQSMEAVNRRWNLFYSGKMSHHEKARQDRRTVGGIDKPILNIFQIESR